MRRGNEFVVSSRRLHPVAAALIGMMFFLPLAGCVVAGVTSSGGAFIWPGGMGLLVILLVLFLLLRRR